MRDPESTRDRSREQRGLIESALDEAPRMKRHRDDEVDVQARGAQRPPP